MKDIIFKIQREPYVPNPSYMDAKAAKEKISSLGGRFYRFSINGCSATSVFETHLIEMYGFNESAVNDALETMAETAIPEVDEKLRELWGIVEFIDGTETTTFAGYAFTEKELESKTKLFIAGVHKLKEHLQNAALEKGNPLSASVSWEI